jgi:hypothetical protein
MTANRDPIVMEAAVADLLPTQMTLGVREVGVKRRRLRKMIAGNGGHVVENRLIPVVRGAGDRLYLIDRHHYCRALLEEGVELAAVTIVADFSAFASDAFWRELERRRWTHPFDQDGCRRHYTDIPQSVRQLADDPFRSLASELRRAGAYLKVATPFSEFRWANYLRHRIDRTIVESDFDRALGLAIMLARSTDARHLPGSRGAAAADGAVIPEVVGSHHPDRRISQ